jgi:adhesin/invasin
MNYRAVAGLLLVVSLLPVAGCDKATPVAPSGTILTISANPSQVALNGRSTITVVGRKPDGNPLNPGTEIRLTAERGTIDSIVTTDSSGTATAVFHADSRSGAVKISAATGGGDAKADTSIQVGQATDQKPTVLLSVNPSTIPINGSATVTVIGRNVDGSPASGQRVTLTSNLGTLSRTSVPLDANGTGTAMLTASTQSGMATVTAVLGSGDPVMVMVTIRDRTLVLQASPASITRPANDTDVVSISLVARVTDFQGNPVSGVAVTFQQQRGTIVPTGTVNTGSDGTAKATLQIRRADLNASDTSFQVTASIPSGSGDPISQTVTITVTSS